MFDVMLLVILHLVYGCDLFCSVIDRGMLCLVIERYIMSSVSQGHVMSGD